MSSEVAAWVVSEASYSMNVGGPTSSDVARDNTGLGVLVGGRDQAGDLFSPRTSASAYAYAAPGILRFEVTSESHTLSLIRNFTGSNAQVSLFWADDITFSGQPRGTRGSFTADILIHGTANAALELNGQPDNSGSVGFTIGYDGGTADTRFFSQQGFSSGSGGGFTGLPSRVTIRREFAFDFPLSIGFSMLAGVQTDLYNHWGGFPQSAVGVMAFGNTVTWGGITGIFDEFGNPITNFSLSSSSGVNYVLPVSVPVPSSGLLLLSSSIALFTFRRRTYALGRLTHENRGQDHGFPGRSLNIRSMV